MRLAGFIFPLDKKPSKAFLPFYYLRATRYFSMRCVIFSICQENTTSIKTIRLFFVLLKFLRYFLGVNSKYTVYIYLFFFNSFSIVYLYDYYLCMCSLALTCSENIVNLHILFYYHIMCITFLIFSLCDVNLLVSVIISMGLVC